MATREVARRHHRQRSDIIRGAISEGARLWGLLNPAEMTTSWSGLVRRLVAAVSGAQLAAARQADEYTDAALSEQGASAEAAGAVVASALAGVASDGRSLEGLLWSPIVAVKMAIAQGATQTRALATGRATLDMTVHTQVADAGRVADGVAIAARPETGYVRMLVPPGDCSRCVVLAGRFYRHNAGFQRHPNCNCVHVPARGEQAAQSEGLVSNPREYFQSLSESEQDRVFTKAGAQAIRDGADIGQVVNARRGAAGLSKAGGRLTREEQRVLRGGREQGQLERSNVFGQEVFATTEGTTRRGLAGQRMLEQGARTEEEQGEEVTRRSRSGDVQRTVRRQRVQTPRLMPESIYEFAEDRDDAIRLLRRFGYIL